MFEYRSNPLGRRPLDPGTPPHPLRVADFVGQAQLQAAPSAFDVNTKMPTKISAYGNNNYGNCTCAAWAIALRTDASQKDVAIDFTDAEVLAMYAGSGFRLGVPSTDNGWTTEASAAWMQTNGMRDTAGQLHTIGPWMQINYTRIDWLLLCLLMFGSVPCGVNLPLTAQHAGLWDDDGGDTAAQQPGSWGGHEPVLVTADQLGGTLRTWGILQPFTWRWWMRYADVAQAKVDPLWCSTTSLAPTGFAIADLLAAQAAIR